jgi:hypothetical protein
MPTGGCFCGAVRNAAKGELLFRVLCYCRGCQTASGTGHVPIAAAERRLERQIPDLGEPSLQPKPGSLYAGYLVNCNRL